MSANSVPCAIKKMLSLVSAKEKRQIVRILAFSVITSILEIATAISIILLTQVIAAPEQSTKYLSYVNLTNFNPHQMILITTTFVGLIYLVKNIFASFEVFFQHTSVQKMNYRFQKRMLEHYIKLNYDFHLTRNASEGLAIISSDTEAIFSNGMTSLAIIFSESLLSICLILTLFSTNPIIGIIIFGVGGIFGLILSKKIFPLFYSWGQKVQDALLLSNKHLLQFFHGFKEIILLGKQVSFINAYHNHSKRKAKVQALQNAFNTLPRMTTELLFIIILILTIAYLSFNNVPQQTMVGILGGYLYAGFRLMPGVNRIVTQLNIFKSIIPCIERVYKEYHQSPSKHSHYVDCPNFHFNKSISLKNIYFKYLSSEQYSIHNLSLDIFRGECIGIIGKTGSGKSTLSDIILGLLIPEKGSALIDNQYPLNSIQWHQAIGYVHQAIYLIDDTILANIVFGDRLEQVDYEKLDNAVKAAQLYDLIEKLPEGIKTVVGERGIRLSGGERQRIAIARALYRNPRVLIFDEATSALDNETERLLMKTIDQIHTAQRTVIIIAHRLTTLQNCDRIIVMKNGAIHKIIPYAELAQSKYQNIYD